MKKGKNNSGYTYYENPFTKVYGSCEPKIILVGTLGGAEAGKTSYTFPYSGKGNRMWCLLPALFDEPSLIGKTDNEKDAFLKKHNIAMHDVCKSAWRKGSGDSSIKDEVVNDFDEIVKKYPNAKIVCVGKKSHEIFIKHFPHIASAEVWSTSGVSTTKSCKEIFTSFRNAFLEKYPNLNNVQTLLDNAPTCKGCTYGNKI